MLLGGDREVVDDDDNTGIYLTILKHLSNIEPVLGSHLSGTSRRKYLSRTVTEEQVQMLSRMTIDEIVKSCKDSKFIRVIVNSTTDTSYKDPMAVLIRFVAVNGLLKEKTEIRKHFIGYYTSQIQQQSELQILSKKCSSTNLV